MVLVSRSGMVRVDEGGRGCSVGVRWSFLLELALEVLRAMVGEGEKFGSMMACNIPDTIYFWL